MSTSVRYTEEQQAAFLEVAVDVGIGRAIRMLGYPASWITAKRWADNHSIEVEVNAMKSKAKSYDLWYNDRDVLLGAEAGMARVMEQLEEKDLDADELKKLAESYQKWSNVWHIVQGRASNITQTQTKDGLDLEIQDILAAENARNQLIEQNVELTVDKTDTK